MPATVFIALSEVGSAPPCGLIETGENGDWLSVVRGYKKEDAGWNVRGESVIRSLRGIRGETRHKSCWICCDHVNTVGYGARRCSVA